MILGSALDVTLAPRSAEATVAHPAQNVCHLGSPWRFWRGSQENLDRIGGGQWRFDSNMRISLYTTSMG